MLANVQMRKGSTKKREKVYKIVCFGRGERIIATNVVLQG